MIPPRTAPEPPARPGSKPDLGGLLARLEEAEETLRAIRQGEVDAVVVNGPDGPRTYTLVTADHSYRTLVEQMREGALTLSREGVILYSNGRLAPLLGLERDAVTGRPLPELVAPDDRELIDTLIQRGCTEEVAGEVRLLRTEGGPVPVQISLSPLETGVFRGLCAVVTDLTEQKLRERAAAEERLTDALLQYAEAAILLCDERGRILRANRRALELCGDDICDRAFDDAFRAGAFGELTGARAAPEPRRDLGHTRPDGSAGFVLAGARPLAEAVGSPAGGQWVITLADITERKAVEAERARLLEAEREARSQAEAANLAKSRFLAIISHELRTPLNAVIGYADLLLEGVGGQLGPMHREHAARIKTSAWHLLGLIEEILAYARVEAGRDSVHIESVDLRTVIADAAELVETQVHDRGLDLQVSTTATPAYVESDPGKLRQILLNLLANAVKFTEQGRIALQLERTETGYQVHVRDSGPGIPARDHQRIFEPFTQLDQSTTRVSGGTGLGLSIARRFAELLGCSIKVESSAGVGSTFTITIPLVAPDSAEARAPGR